MKEGDKHEALIQCEECGHDRYVPAHEECEAEAFGEDADVS